jgi:dihydroorotase
MTTADYLLKDVSLPDGTKADVAIASGLISSMSSDYKGEVRVVLDAKDCVLLTGLVDLHTHLREP